MSFEKEQLVFDIVLILILNKNYSLEFINKDLTVLNFRETKNIKINHFISLADNIADMLEIKYFDFEEKEYRVYENHESLDIINNFIDVMKNSPVINNETESIYTDQELDNF